MKFNGLVKKAMAGVFIIGAAISTSCDQVSPIVPDDTADTAIEQVAAPDWMQDIIDNNSDNWYDGLNCDNHYRFTDGTGSGDSYHHLHNHKVNKVVHTHTHSLLSNSNGHYHKRGKQYETNSGKQVTQKHDHLIFIYHSHEAEEVHTHKCEYL